MMLIKPASGANLIHLNLVITILQENINLAQEIMIHQLAKNNVLFNLVDNILLINTMVKQLIQLMEE